MSEAARRHQEMMKRQQQMREQQERIRKQMIDHQKPVPIIKCPKCGYPNLITLYNCQNCQANLKKPQFHARY